MSLQPLYIHTYIKENTLYPQSYDFYNQKMDEYEHRKSKAEQMLRNSHSRKASRLFRKGLLDVMMKQFMEQDITITAFDEKLWRIMVDSVMVSTYVKLIFTFCNGMKNEVGS